MAPCDHFRAKATPEMTHAKNVSVVGRQSVNKFSRKRNKKRFAFCSCKKRNYIVMTMTA